MSWLKPADCSCCLSPFTDSPYLPILQQNSYWVWISSNYLQKVGKSTFQQHLWYSHVYLVYLLVYEPTMLAYSATVGATCSPIVAAERLHCLFPDDPITSSRHDWPIHSASSATRWCQERRGLAARPNGPWTGRDPFVQHWRDCIAYIKDIWRQDQTSVFFPSRPTSYRRLTKQQMALLPRS